MSQPCEPCTHGMDLLDVNVRFDHAAWASDNYERCETCPFKWKWMKFVGFQHDRTTLANARMLWLSLEELFISFPQTRRTLARPMPEDPEPRWWVTNAPPPMRKQSNQVMTGTVIERIKASIRLEDVVSLSCNLHGYGDVRKAKCPLHNEQNGESLVLWISDQKWKCFGKCMAYGDVIDWMELAHGKGMDWILPRE